MMKIKKYFIFTQYKIMFKPRNGQYIASKSQSIKPDVVSDVLAGDQLRMLLPSYTGFIDPSSTYLKLVVQVNGGRGQLVPEPIAGVHSLFRNVIIRDGSNTTTIENLADYNSMVASIRPFTAQSSIEHKRQLFEGVQELPTKGASLYYGPSADLTGSSASSFVGTDRTRNSVEVYCQLESGLFKGDQIIPTALMQGLRLQIDTEDPARALTQLEWDCSVIGPNGGEELLAIEDVTNEDDIAQDAFERTGQAGLGQQYFSLKTSKDIDVVTQEGNPFCIGDLLYISLAPPTTPGGFPDYEEKLGLIIGFYADAGKLGIVFVPQNNTGTGVANAFQPNTGVLFTKPQERISALSGLIGENDTQNTGTINLSAPTYTISDVEMLCETVQPPQEYVQGMVTKSMTDSGISFDILTSELHRFNQTNAVGITQIQIPTLAKRAKSLVIQPVLTSQYRDFLARSLSGVVDNARDYQFQLGNTLVPSRKVQLQRYSATTPRAEPLHITELQKALININRPVRSLQKVEQHFVIARGLNRYGQVTDLSDETVSLRVEYDSGAELKLFNNFIYKLAKVTIAKGMVMIES